MQADNGWAGQTEVGLKGFLDKRPRKEEGGGRSTMAGEGGGEVKPHLRKCSTESIANM